MKRMQLYPSALALALVIGAPASAQENAPAAAMTSGTATMVTEPQNFAEMAAVSNMFEVMSSEAALEKASKDETKTFAQHMVDDHTKAAAEMKPAAEGEGVTLPSGLDEKHQAKLDELSAKDGEAFDQAYLEAQLAAHQEAVALFKGYSESGAPGTLKEFATKTLPTLERHLQEVQTLVQNDQ